MNCCHIVQKITFFLTLSLTLLTFTLLTSHKGIYKSVKVMHIIHEINVSSPNTHSTFLELSSVARPPFLDLTHMQPPETYIRHASIMHM